MSGDIGYWGCDPNNQLIKDICETWGISLERMKQEETLWLIARISQKLCAEYGINEAPSEEAQEVCIRLSEIDSNQKIALIQALADS